MDGCTAPSCIGTRHGESLHCRTHIKKFHTLYSNYKKAQVPMNVYIDNPDKLQSLDTMCLLRLVKICNTVTVLRKQYQTVAFKPRFRDQGHAEFIAKLQRMSSVIVGLLSTKFSAELVSDGTTECDTDSSDGTTECDTDEAHADEAVRCVNTFVADSKALDKELDMLVAAGIEDKAHIRREVMNVYNEVRPLVEGDLTPSDRTAVFVCSMDLIEGILAKSISEQDAEQEYLGDVLSMEHVLPRSDYVIQWRNMPSSLEESIEYIYQGRRPPPTIPDNPLVMIATASLIGTARDMGSDFSFHFDVGGARSLTPMVYTHASELTGKSKTYYPPKLKKR